ncbi:MAG: SPOR domain-containing protein [Candidatus Rokubacteria bacterium]|nr:SPOR domain-containing protein [Candidatus Rokubacteria bacterium]
MADDDRQSDEPDTDEYDGDEARSIFSAIWFRVVLVVIVLGVAAAVAVPYVLEWVNPPAPKPTTAAKVVVPAAKAPAAPAAVAPVAPPPPARVTAQPAPAPAPTPPVMPAPAPSARKAPPATAAPAPPADTSAVVPKSAEPAKAPAAVPRRAAKAAATVKVAPARTAAGSGAWFVQVGAFKDPAAAARLATTLRERKFKVEEAATEGAAPARAPAGVGAGSPGDRYDVFVSGGAPAEVTARLTAKGLAAEASGAGVVVKPSLPLRDAVALSKDLAAEGFKVQVRRAGGAAPAAAAKAPAPRAPAAAVATAAGDDGLTRVRVGPYPTRAAATAAQRDLEALGYKAFIARGGS